MEQKEKKQFNLKFLGSVKRQKQAFLDADQIAPQKWPTEILQEFERLIRDEIRTDFIESTGLFFAKRFRKMFSLLIANKILGRLCFAAGLLLSQRLLTEKDHQHSAFLIWLGFTSAMLGNLFFNYFSKVQVERLSSGLAFFLTNLINKKLMEIDYARLDSTITSAKIKVLLSSDIKKVQRFLNGVNNNLIPTIVTLLIFVPLIVFEIGWLGVVATFIIFVLIPIAFLLSNSVHRFQSAIQSHEDKVVEIVGEWVRNFRLTRYLNLEESIRARIANAIRGLLILLSQQHILVALNFSVAMIWWMVPIASLFYLADTFHVSISLASLFSVVWLLNEITNTVRYLPFTILDYSSASACLNRIRTLLNSPNFSQRYLPPQGVNPKNFLPLFLHLKNIRMQFGDKVIFENLNLKIDLKAKTAVVGRVASGKSTLAKILVGELVPTDGELVLELADHSQHPLWAKDVMQLWRNWIAYVPQEPYIANDKIKNNISLDTQTEGQALFDAVQIAQLEPDLAKFPNGLDEEIGESGNNLSGGQKQRLTVARALYFQRHWTVLDNPTSAVDNETRHLIQTKIAASIFSYLILTNSHSEIAFTEKVIVLDKDLEYLATQAYLQRSE